MAPSQAALLTTNLNISLPPACPVRCPTQVTTKDGHQYMVDGGTGLAIVPEAHRDEVKAQLEMLQMLANAALRI